MNKETFSPDKVEDIYESLDKISTIFKEYNLTPQEAIAIAQTILSEEGNKLIKRGNSGAIICEWFTKCHNHLIDHILDFEESLNE